MMLRIASLVSTCSVIALSMTAGVSAQTAEQRIARLEAELRNLRSEVSRQAATPKPVAKTFEQQTYSPPIRAPFSWTGVYAGVFVGGAYQASRSRTTYGPNPVNGIGFGPADANGAPVGSTWYQTYSSGGPAATIPYAEAYSASSCSGSGCSHNNSDSTAGPFVTGNTTFPFAPTDATNRGVLGALGVQLGANYQVGRLVLGVAGDFSWLSPPSASTFSSNGAFNRTETVFGTASSYSDATSLTATMNGQATQTNNGQSAYSGMSKISPQWLSTLRLNAGVAEDRFMAFVSGGLAFGSVQSRVTSRYNDTMSSTCDGSTGGSIVNSWQESTVNVDCGGTTGYQTAHSDRQQTGEANWRHSRNRIQTGFTIGGGFGYAMTDHAILKLESYYYNLGSSTILVNGVGTTTTSGTGVTTATANVDVAPYRVRTRINGVIGRVGVDFKY